MASIDIEDLNDLADEDAKEVPVTDVADDCDGPGKTDDSDLSESSKDDEEDLQEKLDSALTVAAQNYEKYLLAVAELANYKKRVEKEKSEIKSFANEKLLLDVLPVADNLQRALEHAGKDGESNLESLTEGVSMTIGQLFKVLGKFGLTEVKAVGEKFDPEFHHAISHDSTTDAEPGTVVSEFQKGFILKGRLIRPAMVSVANDEEGQD